MFFEMIGNLQFCMCSLFACVYCAPHNTLHCIIHLT